MVKVVIVFRDPERKVETYDARYVRVHDWFLQVAFPGTKSIFFSAVVVDHVDSESVSSIEDRPGAEKTKVVIVFRDSQQKPAVYPNATFAKTRGGFLEVAFVTSELFRAKYYPVDTIEHVECEAMGVIDKTWVRKKDAY